VKRVLGVYREAVAGLPAGTWILSAGLLVNRAGTMVLPFLALWLTTDRGWEVETAGLIVGVYGLGSMIGSYAGGWASDWIGPVRTQKLSLVLTGACMLVLPALDAIPAVCAAVLLVSMLGDAFRPALMASLAETTPPALRARGFALMRQAGNLGMAIGPAAGGLLATFDYTWLFVCDALTCWAAALLLQGCAAHIAPSRLEAPRPTGVVAAGSPWRDLPFLALIALVVVVATVLFQIFSTVPLYLRESYRLNEAMIGSLFALNGLLILVFELPLIRAVEGIPRLPLIGAGSLLMCIGLAVLPLGTSLALAAASVAIWTLGEMLALPLLNAFVADRASEGRLGRYLGLYALAYSIAFMLAPIVGASIYQHFGGDVLWLSTGAAGPVLLAWSLSLRRWLRDGQSSSSSRQRSQDRRVDTGGANDDTLPPKA
jgi:predicted MFS family arabinose efflux permease